MKKVMLLIALASLSGCDVPAPQTNQGLAVGGVKRTPVLRVDDTEKGVSCYVLDGHRGISCVKVAP